MKNIVNNIVKDPVNRKVLVLIAVNGMVTYLLWKSGLESGVQAGGNTVISAAERMTPGFREQFEKFVTAEKFGWKNV